MRALRLNNAADVAFSASAATAGGHAALRHVSGSALWGVAAGASYRSDAADTFAAVHSGRTRISPAFPLAGGEAAFPAPQVLREPKHARGGVENGGITAAVWNTIGVNDENNPGVGETLKGWYVAGSGAAVRPKVGERGKTAIVRHERRAAEGQYFQYEHLAAGQDWLAFIDGDEEVAAAAALVRSGLRLGRSGLQEYGGDFTVAELADWDDPRAGQLSGKAEGRLILWCLSDLACIDDWGTADFEPAPEALGVGSFAGTLNLALSAMTTRRYAPWNAYLDALDREHAAIEAGSVLVYDLEAAVDLERFRDGCGRWRERGLGLVWPNPPLLMDFRPEVTYGAAAGPVTTVRPAESAGRLTPEENALIAALKTRRARRSEGATVDQAARALVATLLTALNAARGRGEATPGPTQWSRLAVAAESAATAAALREALLAETGGLCVGPANPDWRSMLPALDQVLTQDIWPAALARAAWRLRDPPKGGTR